MKNFKSFLTEYLTDEQRARYADVQVKPEARAATDHFFGAGNDHVREDVIGLEPEKSEVHRAVERHLGKEISHEDYTNNTIPSHSGRPIRLARLIRDEHLRNQFANDRIRVGSRKSSGHYMTIVRGTEVAGQTNSAPDALHPNGHSWGNQSCKNIDTGINRHYLDKEIHEGTVLVRAHDQAGQEIYRATLQPHTNSVGRYAYAVDSEYGLKHPSFTAHAHDVTQRLSGNPDADRPVHHKNENVYDDNDQIAILHPNLSHHHLQTFIDNKDDNRLNVMKRRLVAIHPNVTPDQLRELSQDSNKSVRLAVADSRMSTSSHLNYLTRDPSRDVIVAAAENPNMDDSHLTEILSHPLRTANDRACIEGAAANRALRPHHFEILKTHTGSQYEGAKNIAARNHSATEDYLLHCLEPHHTDVKAINAAYNHSASEKVLSKALDHPKTPVRMSAVENPKMSHALLHKALDDEDEDIRVTALDHPNITDEHLEHALKDENPYVHLTAAGHQKASIEFLKRTARHPDPDIANKAQVALLHRKTYGK